VRFVPSSRAHSESGGRLAAVHIDASVVASKENVQWSRDPARMAHEKGARMITAVRTLVYADDPAATSL
jgi:hypothetical protein